MLNTKSLFLSQSYIDCCTEYENSLINIEYPAWDYVIITASNKEQAKNYQFQIDERRNKNMLVKRTKYIVIPDLEGMRVGSGGATLNVLAYLNQNYGISDFTQYKILLIHSGGDSKRIPQFSACGKLFAPVPRMVNNGNPSTIFDEFIITTTSIPMRMKCGMLVMSGDVLLLFNPLQIDFNGSGAGALSIRTDAETGTNHGVFLCDQNNRVIEFLHKRPVSELLNKGATMDGQVDIDTGAILLGGDYVNAMYSLISDQNMISVDKCKNFINDEVRLSFYGDFVYLLAQNISLEKYLQEETEGVSCDSLTICRREIWDKLHNYTMNAIKLYPSKFIHFGTTREYLNLCCRDVEDYNYLGWAKNILSNISGNTFSVYNSLVLNSVINGNSLIENSGLCNCLVNDSSIVSNIYANDINIPSNIVMHGVYLLNGKYVTRIYGIDDNPKLNFVDRYFGYNIASIISKYNIDLSKIVEDDKFTLWDAKLFPVSECVEDGNNEALLVWKIFEGIATVDEVNEWLSLDRISLADSFRHADMSKQINVNGMISSKIVAYKAINLVENLSSYDEFINNFKNIKLDRIMVETMKEFAHSAPLTTRIRINHYLSKLFANTEFEIPNNKCFEIIRNAFIDEVKIKYRDYKFIKQINTCDLPVRINLGGGWTDTPPYCIDNGGTVLNCAIKLNGQLPIKIVAKKLNKKVVCFECLDINCRQEFDNIDELLSCGNTNDPFALHKSCLIAMGIIKQGDNLNSILSKLGGGIYLSTDVLGIPRGSGLGTSSILAGGCVKVIFEILGYNYSNNEIYETVLLMEQLMSTGGGWQDQVGGLIPGVKFITSDMGIEQDLHVENVIIRHDTVDELNDRFALIYTGQRRLARNLLRKVMGNYIERVDKSIKSLKQMEYLACQMKREIQRGDINALANLMNIHWECSKTLDDGTSNTCIDYIFKVIDDMIDGKMICGAGGGGFLQVIIKSGYTKDDLQSRLKSCFGNSGVCVWNSEFYFG